MSSHQAPTDASSTPDGAQASSAVQVAGQAGFELGGNAGRGGARGSTQGGVKVTGSSTSGRGGGDATQDDKDTVMVDAPAIQGDGEDAMDVDEEDYPMADVF